MAMNKVQFQAGLSMAASYEEHYLGDDNGTEGDCEGAYFGKGEYDPIKLRTVYGREGFGPFNPDKAKSKELKDWAEKNCGCKK